MAQTPSFAAKKSADGTPPLIRLENICKSYGPVRANRNISLEIRSGEILALLGENGAGKSTLMSILSGKSRQDSGTIFVDGLPSPFRSPRDALAAGIGMVYQHFMLVEAMTVTQNLMLGQAHGILNPAAMRARVLELAERYGFEINPDAMISDLSMGERQRVEILKLLYRDCRVLILDEPTAVLTPPEISQLFSALRRMAADGKAIVFISHKMKEVLDLATEISILRRGEIVEHFLRSEVPGERELAERMVGRQMETEVEQTPVEKGEVLLELDNACCGMAQSLSCTLRRGEVLAVVGVAGNGQRELVEMVTGGAKPEGGSVRILGKSWSEFMRTRMGRRSMVYIPEDRKGLATCPSLDLLDNFLLTNRNGFQNFGFLDRRHSATAAADIMEEYQVVADGLHATAGSLSGGNLQKMVLGREFFREPSLIVAENPTQGLDIGAMEEVWRRILDARDHAGVLLVTSDLREAMTLADTFAVMYRGRFIDVFPRSDEARVESIGLMMAGIRFGEDAENGADKAQEK
ncbi:ABC transporter ATP-binding protein [uncultured Mailhella sp.]|uniref:ABC transporter ATP-binding protein n=1 Tax=uncultured Mailhella sp. TaxID=1981031 RepID=UPI0032084429